MSRPLVFLWLSLLDLAWLPAQQPDLLQNFDTYCQALTEQRWDQSLDFLHPVVFEQMARTDLLREMEALNADSSTEVFLQGFRLRQAPLAMTEGTQRIALVAYEYDLVMDLLGDAEEAASTASFMASYYEGEDFGYDEARQRITVRMRKRLFAFLQPGWTTWRFLEDAPEAQDLLARLVPDRIRSELEMGLRLEAPDEDP
mgnify:CR=1 FL=1